MTLAMIAEDHNHDEIDAVELAPGMPHVSEFGRVKALERRFAELAGELVHVGREWLFEWNNHAAARMSSSEIAVLISSKLSQLVPPLESRGKVGITGSGRSCSPRLPVFPSRARAA